MPDRWRRVSQGIMGQAGFAAGLEAWHGHISMGRGSTTTPATLCPSSFYSEYYGHRPEHLALVYAVISRKRQSQDGGQLRFGSLLDTDRNSMEEEEEGSSARSVPGQTAKNNTEPGFIFLTGSLDNKHWLLVDTSGEEAAAG